MIRVLVIEHQALAREGLSVLIEAEAGMRISAAAVSVEAALTSSSAARSDVALLDVDAPEVELDAAVERLRTRLPDLAIVVLSSRWSDEIIGRALSAGVNGYVLKEEGFAAVSAALRRVCQGEPSYSRRVRARLAPAEDGEPLAERKTRFTLLSQRERQLLRLLATGKSLRRACESLGISYKSADKHKSNLMKKLNIHDRVELARYAIREGIIEP